MDLENNPITAQEAKKYLIVLDGQHRISAFAKLNAIREPEKQITIPTVHIKKELENVREYLADINMVGHNWSMSDKVCVSAIASNSKVLDKVNELIKEGYNASAAMSICIGKRLTPTQLKEIIINGEQLLPDETEALKRADKYITTTKGILGNDIKLLTKRYFINGFNNYAAAHNDDDAFEALGKLTIDDFKSVKADIDFIEKLKAA